MVPYVNADGFIPTLKGTSVNLTPLRFAAFFIACLCGGAGVEARLGYLAVAAPYAFWLVAIGFVLLMLGSHFRGLQPCLRNDRPSCSQYLMRASPHYRYSPSDLRYTIPVLTGLPSVSGRAWA